MFEPSKIKIEANNKRGRKKKLEKEIPSAFFRDQLTSLRFFEGKK
jgi:hypothetical protein